MFALYGCLESLPWRMPCWSLLSALLGCWCLQAYAKIRIGFGWNRCLKRGGGNDGNERTVPMITKLMAALSAGQLALCSTHALCAPVAVVEEVKGNPPDIEFMDYVEPGRVIRLGAEDSVVLGYLESCMREAITGGTATVGTQQSSVELGKVERTKVACDAGHMLLSAEQASQTAAMVFRRGPSEPAQPQFTLYGLSPVVEVKGGGTVVIERVGKSRERYVVTLERKELEREAFYDFSNAGKALTAGGIYRAAWNEQQLVFQITSDALPGHAPVIGRLLRFSPRN